MLEQIKKTLGSKYDLNQPRGLFLSSFNSQGAMISSNGSIQTDKPLGNLIDLLYHGLVEKQTDVTTIVADVVLDIYKETDIKNLQSLDLKVSGLCLVGEQKKSGTILPGTQGVTTIQQALQLVKDKYKLHGNATIYVFHTDRMIIEQTTLGSL